MLSATTVEDLYIQGWHHTFPAGFHIQGHQAELFYILIRYLESFGQYTQRFSCFLSSFLYTSVNNLPKLDKNENIVKIMVSLQLLKECLLQHFTGSCTSAANATQHSRAGILATLELEA